MEFSVVTVEQAGRAPHPRFVRVGLGFFPEKKTLDIDRPISHTCERMISTRQAAKRLGLSAKALSHYIATKKVPAPETVYLGRMRVHSWTEREIEHVRKILPKIANGRKTRYQKKRAKKKGSKKVSKKK
jgi:predicted DNA-binding transcriptional regulator AlpA